MTEVNDTATETKERSPKGSPIAKGRKRKPAEVAAPAVEAAEDKPPETYGGYARWLADHGVKNAYSEAKRRRPGLYRDSMQEALRASQTTVRRK